MRTARGRTLSQPTADDFKRLLAFRVALRRFQRWSETQAQLSGLTHVQHQLLVAVKGHKGDRHPTISDVAGYLLLRHNSAVELVDRAVTAGLVQRATDPDDARVVRIELTGRGDELVARLTNGTLSELHELAVSLNELCEPQEGHAQFSAPDGSVPCRAISPPPRPRQ
ncbi:MAG TPA: MarR family winged helix-turn-helix transcriptional regulator [Mycobacterium sp.]|nr:MarR family winged helix-turn-helix transcriptional regulator [Mycobacterium sp.]